jgi:hypothetical protein
MSQFAIYTGDKKKNNEKCQQAQDGTERKRVERREEGFDVNCGMSTMLISPSPAPHARSRKGLLAT